MKNIPLNEGAFTIDASKEFIPFDDRVDELSSRTSGSLLVKIQPFVVLWNNQVILLDTGSGVARNHEMLLHENLLKNGIEPDSVSMVLLSHLHKDHAGGIFKTTEKGIKQTAFPNAVYYVHEKELAYALENIGPSYNEEHFSLLAGHAQLQTMSGDSGTLIDGISFQVSGGHCPYHTVFWIEENNEKIFFGADVAPQLQQMKRKVMAKYDFDGRRSMELREKWWQQGKEEHWTFLFYHDVDAPSVTL